MVLMDIPIPAFQDQFVRRLAQFHRHLLAQSSQRGEALDAHQIEGIKRLSFHIPAMNMFSVSQAAAIVRILESALAAGSKT